jgi:hypothetical protein
MTYDIIIACDTCARRCGDAPPSKLCPRWHDAAGNDITTALYLALRASDAREKAAKTPQAYYSGEDGPQPLLH